MKTEENKYLFGIIKGVVIGILGIIIMIIIPYPYGIENKKKILKIF